MLNKNKKILGLSLILSLATQLSSGRCLADYAGNPSLQTAYDFDYVTTIVVLSLPKDQIRGMLPKEATLMSQDLTPEGQHPLYLIHNRFSKMEAPGVSPFSYDEFLTYIPAIRLKDGFSCQAGNLPITLGQSSYMPVLYLNSQGPVEIGVRVYGFNKELTLVDATADSFDVFAPGSATKKVYSAQFGQQQALTDAGKTNLAKVLKWFPESFLGKSSDTMIWSGFSLSNIQATYSVDGAKISLDKKALGLASNLNVSGINDSVLGAFRIQASGTGSIPATCSNQMTE